MDIKYEVGDATKPTAEGDKIVAHVCNDHGAWGKGFVLAISRRWPQPAEAYKRWFNSQDGFGLGAVQFVQVEPDLWVANMVAQHGLRAAKGIPPIRYEALQKALARVADKARQLSASVHMPRVGCGLAGGQWQRIEPIIRETLLQTGVPVTVYDLPATAPLSSAR